MKLVARLALVAAVLCIGSPAAASAQSAGPPDPPSITLSVPAATIGQQVSVSGQHFAPMTAMSMQVCGNEARGGSTDCDVAAGQTVLTDEHGEFRSHLNVRFPPVPCPCVVWVTSHNGPLMSATAPIGVIAANYTPPPPDVASNGADIEVVRAELVQGAAWRGWLGLPLSAHFRLTVRNPGESTIAHPVLSLRVGSGDDPSGVLDAPQLDALRPGEERTIEVPVSLGPLAHGSYTVKGTIGSTPVTFRATTSVFPWGVLLLVIGVTAAVGAALLIRRRRRPPIEQPVVLALPPALSPEPNHDDVAIAAPIVLHLEEPTIVNLTDDELPQMASDDELVAWGASLVSEADDTSWLTDRDHIDVTPAEDIIIVEEPRIERPAVDVAFLLPGYEEANCVSVCGDFNDWSPVTTPMEFRSGFWRVIVPLESDRDYRYRFLVDGEQWLDDPFTTRRTPNDFGGHDSVVHTRRVEDLAPDTPVSALA